ncbi:hypothetical protein U9M73_07130 [Paenibacillus phoenicis]|uniref:Uncharacterized protein n=1 Tax=Paenibacillus phoenicis TaxID=554117 RepID=A0ABU5PIK1_9BACL|nr:MULTISPECIES: hypothetical protein [Paenibacillus]MCT2195426.1 hypothetical protein [Paenibacillus sp. p3-SID1389]MEA3569771.1 hypothetical protein [Paenibacillus phoenicis]
MVYIGILYVLIMTVDWMMQKKEGVQLKTRMTVLLVSICFFITSEVTFKLKEQWNVIIMFQYLCHTLLGRSY